MSEKSAKGQKQSLKSRIGSETVLKGRAVSRGIGIGEVLYLHGQNRQFYRFAIKAKDVDAEIARFCEAVDLARTQLSEIRDGENFSVSESQSKIFETHLLFLEDKSLLSKIEDVIRDEHANAEWAVKLVTDTYVARYKLLSDKHLREKYIDLQDIADRLLSALSGGRESVLKFDKNAVVIAKEINPSTLVELSQHKPRAIVTENGGWTSHSFILAREMNIPAVTGLRGILRLVNSGDAVVVDGYSGQVLLQPNDESLKEFRNSEEEFLKTVRKGLEAVEGDVATLDGVDITVRANLDHSSGFEYAAKHGGKGIGLYRSEYLFNRNKGYPTEALQIEEYTKIAKLAGDEGVRLRTFDLSVEELTTRTGSRENNPALGLKAIRLGLTDEKQFRRQLRALLIASYNTSLDIVLPMISDVSEIRAAKILIEEEKQRLATELIDHGNPGIGAMIEVPSAVFIIDEILAETDFISLGTNDLVQYLLAVDRDNEDVADWFQTLHPAVLRSVERVLGAAKRSGKPAIICGEMAGSPVYAAILIGMGAKELSMNPNSIPRVKRIIQGVAFEEAAETVDRLMECVTADEVKNMVNRAFTENWAHLFKSNELIN